MKKTDQVEEIEVNGRKFVPKDSVTSVLPAADLDGKPYVVVRTHSAGVHVGYLESRTGKEVKLIQTRRLWYWDGAATLSQLALSGVTKPMNCKFSVIIPQIELTEAIEIIQVTKEAQDNIAKVPVWKI
jgi:hypothetical protein